MRATATSAGTFKIGGDIGVNRLGFGAMRITGEGIWGPPEDPDGAIAVLERLPELGVDFIDTADSYGPEDSENLIREALHPFDGVHVATKGGFTRHGPAAGRRSGARSICASAADEPAPARPRNDRSLAAASHRCQGPARGAVRAHEGAPGRGQGAPLGLSEVSVEEIKAAQQVFEVATVQNIYNLTNRQHEDVLDYCEQQGIGFIPWFPLAAGGLAEPGGAVAEIAAAHDATAGQVALAWLLARSPVMLPIPGTGSVEHLEENVAAADLELTAEELARLDEASGES